MTQQEQQMIDGLVDRVRSTVVQNKDVEAEQHIRAGLGSTPDALYVLTQTVLVQQYGLEQAQSQLNELKQQNQLLQDRLQQTSQPGNTTGGSFLSHIFGGGSKDTSATPPASQYQPVNNPGYGTQPYPPPPPPPVAYPSSSYAPGGGMFGGGGGGFLQGALQTAAGVAAGEMVFQGMEDLFHGFGGHREGYGFGGGGGETVVNNYYDDDRGADRNDRGTDREDRSNDNSSFYNPSDDASRDDLSSANTQDFSASSGDDAGFNDSSNDDLGFDNSGGDNGGFDNGGGDDFSGNGDGF